MSTIFLIYDLKSEKILTFLSILLPGINNCSKHFNQGNIFFLGQFDFHLWKITSLWEKRQQVKLFPFNSAGRFGGDIIYYTIDSPDRIHNPVGYFCQRFRRHPVPVRCHTICAGDGP